MTSTKIYLELSDEIQQALSDNSLNVEDVLRRQGIDVEVTHGISPYKPEGDATSKDLATIVLASSAVVFAVGMAIAEKYLAQR